MKFITISAYKVDFKFNSFVLENAELCHQVSVSVVSDSKQLKRVDQHWR